MSKYFFDSRQPLKIITVENEPNDSDSNKNVLGRAVQMLVGLTYGLTLD